MRIIDCENLNNSREEENDPVDSLLVEEGVTEIMQSMASDGELIDFNGINVKEK